MEIFFFLEYLNMHNLILWGFVPHFYYIFFRIANLCKFVKSRETAGRKSQAREMGEKSHMLSFLEGILNELMKSIRRFPTIATKTLRKAALDVT